MRVAQDVDPWFAIGDRDDLDYGGKLAAYRTLADEYFETSRYEEFVDESLGRLDELTVEYFESTEFDELLVQTVRSTFPEREQEHSPFAHNSVSNTMKRAACFAGPSVSSPIT